MQFVLELTGDEEKYDEALNSIIEMLSNIKGLGFKIERFDMKEK